MRIRLVAYDKAFIRQLKKYTKRLSQKELNALKERLKLFHADAFAAPVEPGTETDTGVGTTPQGNTANNMVRGMQGGEVAGNDMQALQSAITG